jgi:hypothetical protein
VAAGTTLTVRVTPNSDCPGCLYRLQYDGGAQLPGSGGIHYITAPANAREVGFRVFTANAAGTYHDVALEPSDDYLVSPTGSPLTVKYDVAATRATISVNSPNNFFYGNLSGHPVYIQASPYFYGEPVTLDYWAGRDFGPIPRGFQWLLDYEINPNSGPVSGVLLSPATERHLYADTGVGVSETNRGNAVRRLIFTPLPGEKEIKLEFGTIRTPTSAAQDPEWDLEDPHIDYYYGPSTSGRRRDRGLVFSITGYDSGGTPATGDRVDLTYPAGPFPAPVGTNFCIPRDQDLPPCLRLTGDASIPRLQLRPGNLQSDSPAGCYAPGMLDFQCNLPTNP